MADRATSRRNLLAASLGALGAIAARVFGGTEVARATSGEPLVVDQENSARWTTTLHASSPGFPETLAIIRDGEQGKVLTAKGGSVGIQVTGAKDWGIEVDCPGTGVWSRSSNGEGVTGLTSGRGVAVRGQAHAARDTGGNDAPAWPSTVGVLGTTVDPATNDLGPGDGVMGRAGTGTGVYGTSVSGRGVIGESKTGAGVYGISAETGYFGGGASQFQAPPGTGVFGWGSQIGIYAQRAWTGATALQADGRVRFSRSGRATVATRRYYVDVTVPDGLVGTPLIFANLGTYRTGIWVSATRPNYPSSGKVRIYLNKAVPGATYVYWLVLG